ncbi:MAG: ATPase, T2SS/T4P/T4SS family [Pirellulales bacterium]
MGLFGKSKKKAESSAGPVFVADGQAALPPLDMRPSAFSRDEAQGVMIAARQLPGFPVAVRVLYEALRNRADRILMDFTAQGVAVRFRVDGIWENMPAMDRPTGDSALGVIKKIFGMNPNERRARQKGKCGAHLTGIDWLFECVSQGVPSGERVLVSIDPKKPVLKSLSDLGMRDKMQESLKNHLNAHGGLVVISGPAGSGLPTTWKIALETADKFVRDFISVEDKDDPDPEIINVTKVPFDKSANETPQDVFARRLLKQPDVFIFPSFHNEKVVDLMLGEVSKNDRHVITRVVANDAVEAIVQLASTYPKQAKSLISITSAVLNQRLIRRLCDKCKQPFQPSPQLLQKLGIPAGRVSKLYQPYVPPPPDQRVDAKGNPIEVQICNQCGGRGYFGKIAIFELLEVTDEFRNALLKQPNPVQLRQVAASLGHRSFQEEGVLAAALGLTSLQELQRMMQAKAT